MESPETSVVIPTYNRPFLLKRAIASVLSQTYKKLECIVVDDCSLPDTRQMVKGFNDQRVIYIKNNFHGGPNVSRNQGIKTATGKYIAFLDDDDEWLPQKLQKQINKFLEAPEAVGLIYCGFDYAFSSSGRIIKTMYPVYRGRVYEALLQSCILASPTPLIKRECFDHAGLFDEELSSCQDWDMWIRIGRFYEFDYVPEILAKHYVHGKQLSVDLSNKISARTLLLKKYQNDLNVYPAILSFHFYRLAVLHCLAGDYKQGRKLLLQAIRKRPLHIDAYIHLFFSWLPYVYKKTLLKQAVFTVDNITFYY